MLKIASCDMFIYVGGESDAWVEDALKDETVPGLTKTMIEQAVKGTGFELTPYQTANQGNYLYIGR